MPKGARGRRARLLRVHEAAIAERARTVGPEEVVLVIDGSSDSRLISALAPDDSEAERLVAAKAHPLRVLSVDAKRLVRATLGRWPQLAERYSVKAPAGEVWVLVVSQGEATLASFSRNASGGGPAVVLVEFDGWRR